MSARRIVWLAASASLLAATALAKPTELAERVEAAAPAGCAEYRFLLFELYRAELWSDAAALPGPRFALSLVYRTDFSREELVETSIEEMARISGRPEAAFEAARRELETAFAAVAPGDRFTAWRAAPDRLELFLNGARTGALTRQVDLFLSIWLGRETRFPDRREALVSGRCDG